MRVTFLLPHAGMNGGVRVVAGYAQHLHERGHRVTVLSTRRLRPPPLWRRVLGLGDGKPERSHFDGLDVPVTRLPHRGPITAAETPDADVLVATWWQTAQWVAALPASKGVKVYFVQHDERVIAARHVAEVAATWRLPMHKIAVARWLADLAAREFGDAEVEVVANGVDTRLFGAPPRAKAARPTVGFMFSQSRFKAAEVAVAAVAQARRRVPELDVVSFGLQPPTSDHPLPDGTRFEQAPPQHRLAELYAACDAWIVPSRCEGFGLPILEAMACRTPVIATRTGAAPELVAGGGGWLVDVDDVDAIAQRIVEAAQLRPEAWRALSDSAFATAQQNTLAASAAAFEDALQRQLQRAREPERQPA